MATLMFTNRLRAVVQAARYRLSDGSAGSLLARLRKFTSPSLFKRGGLLDLMENHRTNKGNEIAFMKKPVL
jgi:hypothetical protein